MPVRIDSRWFQDDDPSNVARPSVLPPMQLPQESSGCLTIGLVNNMPEAAFQATERQFVSLLDAASGDMPIHLSLYTLTGNAGLSLEGIAGSRYAGVEALWSTRPETRLDGLIVTGTEPLRPSLREESYWASFTRVLEWARGSTCSTVWSCLAAHAAVLHMDGVERCRSGEKHFGVLSCERVAEHWLTEGMPPHSRVPHSRWNGLPEEQLTACGYRILTRTADAGVDAFVKDGKSLFVFLQGHPEYQTGTLLREYRRDVGRFLKGETNTHPSLPRGYFDRETENALAALRDQALSCRRTELLGRVSSVLETPQIENTWHSAAVCLYRNWLELICERKRPRQTEHHVEAICSLAR